MKVVVFVLFVTGFDPVESILCIFVTAIDAQSCQRHCPQNPFERGWGWGAGIDIGLYPMVLEYCAYES